MAVIHVLFHYATSSTAGCTSAGGVQSQSEGVSGHDAQLPLASFDARPAFGEAAGPSGGQLALPSKVEAFVPCRHDDHAAAARNVVALRLLAALYRRNGLCATDGLSRAFTVV